MNDAAFLIGLGLLAYGLYGWHWQIAAVVLGVLLMAFGAYGALGERDDDGNTRKNA